MAFELSIALEIFCNSRSLDSFALTPLMKFIQRVCKYIIYYICAIRLFKFHGNSAVYTYFLCASKAPLLCLISLALTVQSEILKNWLQRTSPQIFVLFIFCFFVCYRQIHTKDIAFFSLCVCVLKYIFFAIFIAFVRSIICAHWNASAVTWRRPLFDFSSFLIVSVNHYWKRILFAHFHFIFTTANWWL